MKLALILVLVTLIAPVRVTHAAGLLKIIAKRVRASTEALALPTVPESDRSQSATVAEHALRGMDKMFAWAYDGQWHRIHAALVTHSWQAAGINRVDRYGNTLLFYAAYTNEHAVVQELLNLKGHDLHGREVYLVDKDHICSDGRTALHAATLSYYTDSAKALIKVCANPSILDKFGNTALHYAALRGHVLLLGFLIDRNNKLPEIRNNDGYTAADLAKGYAASFFRRDRRERTASCHSDTAPSPDHTSPVVRIQHVVGATLGAAVRRIATIKTTTTPTKSDDAIATITANVATATLS